MATTFIELGTDPPRFFNVEHVHSIAVNERGLVVLNLEPSGVGEYFHRDQIQGDKMLAQQVVLNLIQELSLFSHSTEARFVTYLNGKVTSVWLRDVI